MGETGCCISVVKTQSQTFKPSTIQSGWRRCGLYPWNPELVIKQLTATALSSQGTPEPSHTGWSSDVRDLTPTFDSKVEAVPTPTKSHRYKSFGSATAFLCCARVWHEIEQRRAAAPAKAIELPSPAWNEPRSIREISKQEAGVKAALSRKKRTVNTGGGAIYAEDCRAIVKKRAINKITAAEQAIKDKKQREVTKIMTKWRKLHPTIRNFGHNLRLIQSSQAALAAMARPTAARWGQDLGQDYLLSVQVSLSSQYTQPSNNEVCYEAENSQNYDQDSQFDSCGEMDWFDCESDQDTYG
ncbi:hypothetical protein GQ44DRAFT_756983 [Phaeosphaeriaceae sp. PMI808]|nr:hypothetical protein GQ44DRAFT_756983 [Phaeosphaeriaceae sp. PMI808]